MQLPFGATKGFVLLYAVVLSETFNYPLMCKISGVNL